MFSPQADSGKPLNEDSLMSQESSSFINSKLLQCLTSNVHAYPSLWNKASPEYKVGHKKKLDWINTASNLGINGKSIKNSWMPKAHVLGYFNWLLRIIKFSIRSSFVVRISVLLAMEMRIIKFCIRSFFVVHISVYLL